MFLISDCLSLKATRFLEYSSVVCFLSSKVTGSIKKLHNVALLIHFGYLQILCAVIKFLTVTQVQMQYNAFYTPDDMFFFFSFYVYVSGIHHSRSTETIRPDKRSQPED